MEYDVDELGDIADIDVAVVVEVAEEATDLSRIGDLEGGVFREGGRHILAIEHLADHRYAVELDVGKGIALYRMVHIDIGTTKREGDSLLGEACLTEGENDVGVQRPSIERLAATDPSSVQVASTGNITRDDEQTC